jgi:uncharacterized protein (DUF433 family)
MLNSMMESNMSTATAYPHIVKENGQPARLEKHPRTRVAMIVTDYVAYGWSVDEMHRQHPHLTLAELHAAMAYYYDHAQEIDAEIAAEVDQAADDLRSKPRPAVWLKLKSQGLIK